MPPHWLERLAIASLVTAACCAGIIAVDILRGNKQHIWIMNVVWPITALWSGPLGFLAYFRIGRLSAQSNLERAKRKGQEQPGKQKPFPRGGGACRDTLRRRLYLG